MGLQDEISEKSKEIRTDSYPMSIGEIINLYRDNEIDVHPEFQRFFRWTDLQKTRLIESLLLGIPLPPIFVAQREDGVWDVVDGLQRLSTILQFVGELRNESGDRVSAFVLQGTTYLPSLQGKTWNGRAPGAFTRDQQLYIKRAKLDVNIVLKESDEQAKYELFLRLNTGGTPLTAQEVRNCLLVMAHRPTYDWLRRLANDEFFTKAIALSDRLLDEQYDLELALRYLVFRRLPDSELTRVGDIGEFLNSHLKDIGSLSQTMRDAEECAFVDTFRVIYEAAEDDAFRRFDAVRRRHMGGFLISAFEAVALGIGFHHPAFATGPTGSLDIKGRIESLWQNREFTENSGSGVRASSRIPKVVPLGRQLFKP